MSALMEPDPMDETSVLFASLAGDATPEQWESYKEEMKLGNFPMEDSDAESEFSDHSLSGDDEFYANIELLEDTGNVEGVQEESDEDSDDMITWGYDAADKYVQGKISFMELNNILENPIAQSQPKKKIRLEEEPEPTPSIPVKKSTDTQKRVKKNKPRRKKSLLPKELEGLMGQANHSFANGNPDYAIKICEELIKAAPVAYEPYQLLGVIYDEMEDPKKSFQFFLVAACLNPSDTEEWIRLVELSLEQNEINEAIKCYTKAIRNEPNNINFLWERCSLYEQVGDKKKALLGYEMIIKNLNDPEDGEKCVDIAREIAKVQHDNSDDGNAVKVLETAFSKFPSLITSEDVNFLLELQLNLKLYKAAVKTFVQHCGVKLKMPLGDISSIDSLKDFDDDSYKLIISCVVPEVLPIDLTVKFLICLIRLKATKAMQPLLDALQQENPEEIGDLFLDVAEALMEVEIYESAKSFLLPLISTASYSLPAVWMKYADCQRALSSLEEAVVAYRKVIELAPSYQDARLSLSEIMLGMEKVDEAINVLRQDYEDGTEGVALGIDALYQRCKLLEQTGRWNEYIATATILQYSHCYPLETEEEFHICVANQTCKRRNEALRDLNIQSKRYIPEFIGRNIPVDEMWEIFKKISNILLEQKRYEELQNISIACLSSISFMKNPQYVKDLEFQALLTCYYNGNYRYTYTLVKELVLKNLHNNKAWNLFSLIVIHSQETRHNRFCIRLMMKHQDHLALGYLNGHNAMISGTYKHALGEYMCILKDHPNDPFVTFCVGITFIHMACQKFATKRHLLTIQGFAFLSKYLKLKGDCQETLYNIGRALHQLGIKDAAVHYYKRALTAPLLIKGPEQDVFDLRREIAYNLCLIYQSTGAMDLVHLYSRKYIVV